MTSRSLLLLSACLLACGCGSKSSRSGATTTAAPTTSSTTGTSPSSNTGTTTTTAPPPPANFQPVAFTGLDRGVSSPRGVNVGAHEVQVASDADWTTFWPTHSAVITPPAVDFTRESVLGTFMAPTPGNANGTQVINVWRDLTSDDLRALVREFRQGAWATATVRVTTTPYDLVACATPVSGQGSLTVERQALLDFEVLEAGADNALGVNDPAYTGGLQVFRDAAAFNAFYAQLHPGVRPPAVDFQRDMIVGVLGPHIPRFGNSVETLRLVHDPAGNAIRVRSRVNPYRGGAAPPPAVEAPYQLLRVSPAAGTIRAEAEAALTLPTPAGGLARLHTGPAEARVVRDAARFAALWAARIGGTPPVIDFAVDQVLIAFEPAGSSRAITLARAVQLEDQELAVTIHTQLGALVRDPRYALVTTPQTYGPVSFEEVDVTPRP